MGHCGSNLQVSLEELCFCQPASDESFQCRCSPRSNEETAGTLFKNSGFHPKLTVVSLDINA